MSALNTFIVGLLGKTAAKASRKKTSAIVKTVKKAAKKRFKSLSRSATRFRKRAGRVLRAAGVTKPAKRQSASLAQSFQNLHGTKSPTAFNEPVERHVNYKRMMADMANPHADQAERGRAGEEAHGVDEGRRQEEEKENKQKVTDAHKELVKVLAKAATSAAGAATAFYTIPRAIKAFGDAMVAHRRAQYEDINGPIATAGARYDISALQLRMKTGNNTSGSVTELINAQKRMNENWQPIQEATETVWNKVSTAIVNIGANMAGGISQALKDSGITKYLRDIDENTRPEGEHEVPLTAFIRRLGQGDAFNPRVRPMPPIK